MANTFTQRLFDLIDAGVNGDNKGMSMGLPKLEGLVDGVQKGTYTLLAGGTGSGKTTLALYSYVYKPLVEHLDDGNFRVLYYSFEMSGEILLAKLLGLHIYEMYGIELSYRHIMSRQDKLSPEHYELVKSCIPWLNKVLTRLVIFDRTINADGLYATLKQYAERYGQFETTDNQETWTPHNPDITHLIIIDHLGLLRRGKGRSKKEEIDLASNFLIHFRNKCRFSMLPLIQLNRGSSSMDRRTNNMAEIQLDDLKDSGGPSEDAEIVIAIFNPFREKLQSHGGYDLRVLRDKYRAIQVLKNRLGEADKYVSVNFFGSIGYWKEMPDSKQMGMLQEHEYEPYIHLIPQPPPEPPMEQERGKMTFRF